MIFQSEKTLTEIEGKIPESELSEVKAAIETLKETVKGNDTEAIKADTEKLEKALYAVSEKLYAAQGGQNPGADAGAQQGTDGYYNADFEDNSNN